MLPNFVSNGYKVRKKGALCFMAHYVKIPKDLNDIKEKFMFNLTKRQVVCFGIGLLVGFPLFFLTKNSLGMTGGIFAMGACAAPAIICGVYKKNGVFFEGKIKFMVEFLKKPRKRYYRTTNIYRCIENQIEYTRLRKKLIQAEGGNASGAVQRANSSK